MRRRRRAIAWPAVLGALALLGATPAADDTAPPQGWRPFADYEHTAIVVMPAFAGYGSADVQHTIASHLPEDVTLVLYDKDAGGDARSRVLADYGRFLPPSRIRYVAVAGARKMFWSRDALPVPVIDDAGTFGVVDARYWARVEPDETMAALMGASVRAHPYRFEGGNFMANHLGDCFIVDAGNAKKVPDGVFYERYGCRSLGRLPKRGGIGHIDERARFVDATTVLTDTPDYEPAFGARGLSVITIPRPAGRHESYVNALLVNGTAFVPQFGRPEDGRALQAYRDRGFKIVPLNVRALADRGHGGPHCLVTNYPGPSPSSPRP